ncbi:MAG: sugar ABC transporter substrate-binding protein [Lachnospiraceae bacterium]|nr:sugar ABC transporter substrate-binding protein [Lachnospiraceae bacterium]
MKYGKRGAAAFVLALCTLVMFDWAQDWKIARMIPEALDRRPVLTLWYTDEGLEDYLTKAAYEYGNQHDVRIMPVYQNGLEYLEAVNTASVSDVNMPDLYIISNDSLEKAALAGLAVPVEDADNQLILENYCMPALQAVNYRKNMLAYPFYFETTAFLYNKDYVGNAALSREMPLNDILPQTVGDILEFANHYEATSAEETVFYWDVSDIFYNYFFAGDEVEVGGAYGDDASRINIYNERAIEGLKVYQNLNQFFFIDAKETDYDTVIQDFIDKKIVFTVATSDVLRKLAQAARDDGKTVNYGIARIPDINEQIKSRSLSVTYAVAVNGYGTRQSLADDFAAWLTKEGTKDLYMYTGHIPAYKEYAVRKEGADIFYQEYEESVPVPKLMSTANFGMQMERAYTRIWDGGDVEMILKDLAEQMQDQIAAE